MKKILSAYQIGIWEEIPKRLLNSVIPREVLEKDSSDVFVFHNPDKRSRVLNHAIEELIFDLHLIDPFRLMVYASRIVIFEVKTAMDSEGCDLAVICGVFEIPRQLVIQNIG